MSQQTKQPNCHGTGHAPLSWHQHADDGKAFGNCPACSKFLPIRKNGTVSVHV